MADEGRGPDDITGVEQNKLIAALSYLAVLVLVPLLIGRKDEYIVFHAKQGLVILIGYVIAGVLVRMPAIAVLANLLWVLLMIVSVIGLIQALQGRRWKIPGVYQISELFRI